jgi:hypothetical protein
VVELRQQRLVLARLLASLDVPRHLREDKSWLPVARTRCDNPKGKGKADCVLSAFPGSTTNLSRITKRPLSSRAGILSGDRFQIGFLP